jgi:hypothetical protein
MRAQIDTFDVRMLGLNGKQKLHKSTHYRQITLLPDGCRRDPPGSVKLPVE